MKNTRINFVISDCDISLPKEFFRGRPANKYKLQQHLTIRTEYFWYSKSVYLSETIFLLSDLKTYQNRVWAA